MEFISQYVAHQPDEHGYIQYSAAEHHVWHLLFERQQKLLTGRACAEFLEGLQSLGLKADRIPQLPEVSKTINAMTGWQVEPVQALISARSFFEL